MISQTKIKKLPDGPGIYFLKNKKGKIIYIGKATSLRDRVRSYFSKDISEARSPLIAKMISEISDVEHLTTDSALEALIQEANFIKKYQPYCNTKEKDNKSWNYAVITKEDFPRVLLLREHTLNLGATRLAEFKGRRKSLKLKTAFGPFPQGSALKEGLKLIRKIFSYRHKCVPALELNDLTKAKPCFDRQIGLCPGVCTGEISKQEYGKIVRHIEMFFLGKKKSIIRELEKKMNQLADKQEFERAAKLKRIIFGLTHIRDVSMLKREFVYGERYGQKTVKRIEAYDVAHIAGTSVVGVMIVLENGLPKKSDYRKFKVKISPGVDDTGALKEILSRRLNHPEWSLPHIIVVDGGVAQKNVAERVFANKVTDKICVVAVTKNEKHKPFKFLGDEAIIEVNKDAILLANHEAHRFAIIYHRNRREKIQYGRSNLL